MSSQLEETTHGSTQTIYPLSPQLAFLSILHTPTHRVRQSHAVFGRECVAARRPFSWGPGQRLFEIDANAVSGVSTTSSRRGRTTCDGLEVVAVLLVCHATSAATIGEVVGFLPLSAGALGFVSCLVVSCPSCIEVTSWRTYDSDQRAPEAYQGCSV